MDFHVRGRGSDFGEGGGADMSMYPGTANSSTGLELPGPGGCNSRRFHPVPVVNRDRE